MNAQPKIIVILGQTSTGKSDFAVEIAQSLSAKGKTFGKMGEIISADSRQVYKGMDLGTGKITKKEMQGIPHHLLDVVLPTKVFSVSQYKKLADKKIREITRRGNVPIIVGGTGFYIDAVLDNIVLPEVPPDQKLRTQLAKKSINQLFLMLEKFDPFRAKNIDQKNPVRLIRAIEIAKALGTVPTVHRSDLCTYDVLKIGLVVPDEVLKEKIKTRLLARIKKGMLKEIKDLHASGISWKRMNDLGLEYRHGALHLQGKLSKSEMLEKINTETWHYAKRQKTWFKRDKAIFWIDPRKQSEKRKVLKQIKDFLK